jgi:predicted urease superfamily metal-dependent hydrolase
VFNRELVGDVVLVNGTNPENGDYDGENYDLPLDFINYIMHMHPEVVRMLQFSKGLSSSVALAYRAGVVTKEELEYVMDYADKAQQNGEFMAAVDSVPERFQEILRRSVNYLNDLTKGLGDE